jgi:hypothetical protein
MAIPADLLNKMTLEEKIGQLTMASANQAVTGPVAPSDFSNSVREGRVGSLLNLWGREETQRAQRLAVEGSRFRCSSGPTSFTASRRSIPFRWPRPRPLIPHSGKRRRATRRQNPLPPGCTSPLAR